MKEPAETREGWSRRAGTAWITGSPPLYMRPEPLPTTFSRDDLKPRGWDRLVIHPDNQIKSWFETLIVACVLYTAILEPVKVCFALEINPEADTVLDLLFIFDLGIQFISGYHDSGGKRFPVLILRRVVSNYVNTWFFVDLVAAIPFDRFYTASGTQERSVAVRLPGLIKIVRLLKLRRTIRKWNSLSYGPLLKVCTIVFGWVMVAHWFACGWFVLGWYTCPMYADNLDVNGPWVTQYIYTSNLTEACVSGAVPDALRFPETIKMNYVDLWSRCLYWALATMSSMGYGNAPVAHSTLDFLYSACTQVVGACLAAGIFSNVAQMINQGDLKNSRYQAQLDRVRAFSLIHKLGPSVKAKLLGYNELLFSVNHGLDLYAIANQFPASVQQEVFFEEHRHRLLQVPMFRPLEKDELFLAAIARVMRVMVVLDGDFVFRAGEVGDRMYFIKKGYVRIVKTSNDDRFRNGSFKRRSSRRQHREDRRSKELAITNKAARDSKTAAAEASTASSEPPCLPARDDQSVGEESDGIDSLVHENGLTQSWPNLEDGKTAAMPRDSGASSNARNGSSTSGMPPGGDVLACLGPGDYFGELALFAGLPGADSARRSDGGRDSSEGEHSGKHLSAKAKLAFTDAMRRRSGTATALADCILVVLHKSDFEDIVQRQDIDAHEMMQLAVEELKLRRPSVADEVEHAEAAKRATAATSRSSPGGHRSSLAARLSPSWKRRSTGAPSGAPSALAPAATRVNGSIDAPRKV